MSKLSEFYVKLKLFITYFCDKRKNDHKFNFLHFIINYIGSTLTPSVKNIQILQ